MPAPHPRPGKLSAREVAAVLGVDRRTIQRWVAAGRLTAETTGQYRMLLFDCADIERLLADLTVGRSRAMSKQWMVQAIPSGHYWELHVDGLGVTQCRSLDEAEAMVREYVGLLEDRDASGDVIDIHRSV